MSKIIIGMQKAQNVNKIFLLILLLNVNNSIFSQKILEDRFVNNTNWYQFYNNGTFDYVDVGELGIKREGKGHYTLTKDSLILNFDLTELTESTYHKYTFYENYKDSIEIKFRIITADGSIAKGLNVGSSTDKVGLILENSNNGVIKLKRENNYKKIFFSSFEYNKYDIQIYGAYNYNIDVYLKKTSTYGDAIPIKFVTQKYKILKNKRDYLELQQPNGAILKLKKVEKDFYGDDPFE